MFALRVITYLLTYLHTFSGVQPKKWTKIFEYPFTAAFRAFNISGGRLNAFDHDSVVVTAIHYSISSWVNARLHVNDAYLHTASQTKTHCTACVTFVISTLQRVVDLYERQVRTEHIGLDYCINCWNKSATIGLFIYASNKLNIWASAHISWLFYVNTDIQTRHNTSVLMALISANYMAEIRQNHKSRHSQLSIMWRLRPPSWIFLTKLHDVVTCRILTAQLDDHCNSIAAGRFTVINVKNCSLYAS